MAFGNSSVALDDQQSNVLASAASRAYGARVAFVTPPHTPRHQDQDTDLGAEHTGDEVGSIGAPNVAGSETIGAGTPAFKGKQR